jgi:hypothetical protein
MEAVDGVPPISEGIAQTLEHRRTEPAESVAAIRGALEGAGVTFLRDDGRGAGVRVRTERKAARRAS